MVQSGKKLKSARASGRRRKVQYKKTGKKVKQVKKGAPVKGAKKSLGEYSKFEQGKARDIFPTSSCSSSTEHLAMLG